MKKNIFVIIFLVTLLCFTTYVMAETELPLIKVLATGGTIVNLGGTTENFIGLSGEEFVSSVPGISKYARVEVEQVVNLPSSRLTPEIWLTIAKRINEIFSTEPEVTGVVVTHGTDTMEETAYFLNLTVKSDKPVVLTGAMIDAEFKDSEGPRNLLSAMRLASSKDAEGKGVLVLFNERQIFAARDVEKVNTVRVDAFGGGELGFLGYVDEDGIWFYRQTTKRHTASSEFDSSSIKQLPRVDIVSSYAGADGLLVDALVKQGVKGIVLQATGAGGVAPGLADVANKSIENGMVVVTSTRVAEGRVMKSSVSVGLTADNLSPQKARILLMLALTKTSDLEEIQRMFLEY